MGQSTLSIRMDEDIKKRFDAFCADVGMNATVAVNMFARAVLREKCIPFAITGSNDSLQISKSTNVQNAIKHLIIKEITDGANWYDSLIGIIPSPDLNADDIITEGRLNDYENLN